LKNIPFVGLHAHSVAGSIFDAIGYPQDHMDFAYDNGCDALALTDHGNMNGLAYQVLHARKMQAEGKNFKPIFGCEAYFIPSVDEWREEYTKAMEDKKRARGIKADKASGATVEDEGASKKTQDVLRRRRHLVLLAMNQRGLNNLFKLISESYKAENFYRYPRVDYALLEKYGEGIIAASACLGGVYAGNFWENREEGDEAVLNAMRETSRRMIDIFGDRWYAELQWNNIKEQHQLNQYIIQVAQEFGIGLISTADSHYPNPDAWKDRELYKRLGWLGKGTPSWAENTDLPEGVAEIGYELYPKNGNQMWESYQTYAKGYDYDDKLVLDSITETHRIAHKRIDTFLPDNTVRLPDFVVPAGMTATQALVKLSMDGLKELGFLYNNEYLSRLKYELKVIDDRGFSKYFLTMKAITDRATNTMLTSPGRGSAAGSLVAYALGITQIDPIKYDLLFSRFLRADATDYPDIDYDVADPMALKEVLIEEWGEDTVAPISNWNTLQLRSLIKDISKLYGIPFTEVNNVTSKMIREATPEAKKRHGIKAGVYAPTWQEVMEFSPSLQEFLDAYPDVKTHVQALVGQVRSCSRHAGGVVVAENLDQYMPLINSGGVRQTPWSEGQNVRHLEPMGFIKFDILGLSTLKMIEECIRHILKRHHNIEEPTFKDVKAFYNNNIHPDVINLDDQKVYEDIFHAGKWAGIFQFTEPGSQKFCRRVKPRNIIDISAVTSIFRPGPLAAGVHDDFMEARQHPQRITYLTDEVREITQETYGFLIFQEQIAKIAHTLGKDLSLDEGNKLRKLLTKKGTGKGNAAKRKIYDKFIAGCEEKGIDKDSAQTLWNNFEYFSGYGFNKSHAVSYSMLSYQCAFLFTYYPVEWLAAFLDKEPESRKEKAINIAKKYGYDIAPLDINKSGVIWEISEDSKTLIQPLTSIKGLGVAAIEQILNNRPFKDAEDLLFKEEVVYSKLNKKSLDALCRGGALDNLSDDRFTGMKHFWSACIVDRPKNTKKLADNIETYRPEGDFSEEEVIQFKTDLTGVFPINLVINNETVQRLQEKFVPPISEFDSALSVCWFIPRKIIPRKTKNGKLYWIVEVIDSNNELTRIRCWGVKPEKDKILLNRPYMGRLKYDEDWGFSTYAIGRTFKLLG
jgi:DNA polymerase-3 subunit alpha